MPIETSTGIMKMPFEGEDSVWFKAQCSCGGDGCCHDIEIEVDREYLFVEMHLDTNVSTYLYDHEDNIFQSVWKRIKCAWTVLVHGEYKMYQTFSFRNEKQINDYITALSSAMTTLRSAAIEHEKFRREQKIN